MREPLDVRLTERLRRGPAGGGELRRLLGVSQPTLSRAIRRLEDRGEVVRAGSTRGARYGLARPVVSLGSQWPLYRIDESGAPRLLGPLFAIAPDHYHVRGGPARMAAMSDGLPYYLQDARPAGFLGRAIPAAHPDLGLPPRVQDWSDDHVLAYLVRRGSENLGDLVLGTEALDRHLSGQQGPPLVDDSGRAAHYPGLADAAMRGEPAGSSAQGEHPKFAAHVRGPRGVVPVLVKFSPPRGTAVGDRWADLLVAEGLASEFLAAHGIASARSRLLEAGGRMFLESERFDRVGAAGRRGVVTLHAVDAELHGQLDRWAAAAVRLQRDGLLSAGDAACLALLDAFAELIGNTDRHFGNVSLFDEQQGPFTLAPVYDMLPMLFAPTDGQLVERRFAPGGARAETLEAWPRAHALALGYWERLSRDERLSTEFRLRARECGEIVARTTMRGGVAGD
jgi:hypothetical protein